MGKSRRGNKEYSKEKKLNHENKSLKKELSRLQKQLSRIDLTTYEEKEEQIVPIIDICPDKCPHCSVGNMETVIFKKINENWSFTKCSLCGNRTNSKKCI